MRLALRHPRLLGVVALGTLLVGAALATRPARSAPTIAGQMEAIRGLEVELATYDARFTQANASYQGAKAKVAELDGRISASTAALEKARKDYAAAQSTLASRVSKIYRQPEPTQVELLLRSSSFSEAFANIDNLDRVQRQDGRLVVKVAKTKETIKKTRAALVVDRKEQAKHAADARARLVEINGIRTARRGVLLSARRQLSVMIAAEARRRANAARLAALRGAQRRISRQLGGNDNTTPVVATPSTGSGGTAPTGGGGLTPDVAAKLAAIAQCESGGNPSIVSPSGLYRGKYQFDPSTWKSAGGSGDDPAAASEAEQDRVAATLYSQRGASPWPVCGR